MTENGFKAFISYNHASDREFAPTLRHNLMTINKPWFRRRAMRVFLDEATMPASPGLWSEVQRALDESEYFILLASPKAAQSTWIAREVTYWLQTKSVDNLLIVVTNGTAVWDPTTGDFNWPASTALPDVLRTKFAEEPLLVDLRWDRTSQDSDASRAAKAHRGAARLAARLHNLPLDELLGADIQQHRKTRRWVRTTLGVFAVLTVLAVVASVAAIVQRDAAVEGTAEAQRQQRLATARQLLAQAEAGLDRDPRTALRLALAARSLEPSMETGVLRLLSNTRYAGALPGDHGPVKAVAFATGDRSFATVNGDDTAILWEISDRFMPRQLTQPLGGNGGGTRTAVFAPNGLTLAIAGESDTITLWDVADRTTPRRIEPAPTAPPGGVRSLAYSPDGRVLAAAGANRTIALWDMSGTPRLLDTLPANQDNELNALAFSPDGRTLASGSGDRSTVLWDLDDPTRPRLSVRIQDLVENSTGGIRAVAFAPDGILATAGTQGLIDLWNVARPDSPVRISQLPNDHRGEITAVAFSPDGRTLASGSDDRTAILWDLADPGRPERIGSPLSGHRSVVNGLAFSPDGGTLVTVSEDHCGIVWNTTDRTEPGRVGRQISPTDKADAFAFSPDGRTAAVDGQDVVALWDLADPTQPLIASQLPISSSPTKPRPVTPSASALTFATDRPLLAVVESANDTFAFWDLTDRASPRLVDRRPAPLPSEHTALSPDGGTLALVDPNGTAALTDVNAPDTPVRIDTENVYTVFFPPDGRTLITVDVNGTFRRWQRAGRNTAHPIGDPVAGGVTRARSATLSTNGHLLALGDTDGTVVLWDISIPKSPRQLGRYLVSYSAVTALTFSPDARTLLVAADQTVAVWDITDHTTPHQLGPRLTGFRHGVSQLAFSADTRTVGVLTATGTAVLWDLMRFPPFAGHRWCGVSDLVLTWCAGLQT